MSQTKSSKKVTWKTRSVYVWYKLVRRHLCPLFPLFPKLLPHHRIFSRDTPHCNNQQGCCHQTKNSPKSGNPWNFQQSTLPEIRAWGEHDGEESSIRHDEGNVRGVSDDPVRSRCDELVVLENRKLVCEEFPEGVVAQFPERAANCEQQKTHNERPPDDETICGRGVLEKEREHLARSFGREFMCHDGGALSQVARKRQDLQPTVS